jgi:hypothetical protein
VLLNSHLRIKLLKVYRLLLLNHFREVTMVKKIATLLWVSVITLSLLVLMATSASAQEKTEKKGRQARWEGNVVSSNPDKSTLTVRKVDSHADLTVKYDSSTRWVSQEHGSKKVNDIDASQITDGDRVIVKGTWDKNEIHATLISKRLSHTK